MDDRLSRLESSVLALERTVRALEQRLTVIERQLPAFTSAGMPPEPHGLVPPPESSPDGAPALPGRYDLVAILSFAGRSFIALGGAYLLRALTDSAILPHGPGVALGLAYGIAWFVAADRAGAAGRGLSAWFHGLVASIIAFPLLWEVTVRFKFLGPEATAAAVALVTGLGLAVAVRQSLRAIAWTATISALFTALALVAGTGVVIPFALTLIALGLATLWLGYARHWILLRWPAALAADIAVLALTLRIASRSWGDSPGHVIAVQLLLLTGYVASIAVRTIVRARDVNAFEVVQALAALAVGFGGAVYVAHVSGAGEEALALANLAFAGACYGVAFAFVARRQGRRRNFYFYSTFALILVLVSGTLLLASDRLALAWAALAVATAAAARQSGRATLNVHAAVYVLAAASISGLLGSASYALIGPVTVAWPPFSAAGLAVLGAAAVCWLIPSSPAPDWGEYVRLPRAVIAVVLVWALGGWIVALAAPLLSGVPGAGADAGAVATIRTSVLAAAALALAWTGRHERFSESTWLLYPVLVAGGIKLLLEDLPQSNPSTLFVALALYGIALIAAPRMGRRHAH